MGTMATMTRCVVSAGGLSLLAAAAAAAAVAVIACDVEHGQPDGGGGGDDAAVTDGGGPSSDGAAPDAAPPTGDTGAGDAHPTTGESPCIEQGCVILATLTGEAAGDTFGYVSADLGDIDGDGADDFVIGAPFNAAGGRGAGRAYVYSGKTHAPLFTFTGEPHSLIGFAVGAAGDVDGDGVTDVIVGAPQGGMQSAGFGSGFARIYSGRTGAHVRTLHGEALNDAFGFVVSGVGDLDHDGHADLVVGAPFSDANGVSSGRVVLVSGLTGATLFAFDGEAAGDMLGSAASGIGDVDRDGVPDVVMAARNGGAGDRGRVYVRSGRSGALLYSYDAPSTGADLGWFFATTPGDVNHDGVPDVFASDFSDSTDDAGVSTGRAFVWSGADGKLLLDLAGRVAGEGFGIGRARAGDVDHDGYDDLIIGAYTNSVAAPQAGRTYVISGKTGADLRTMTSSVPYEGSGYDAVGLGDVNGDGALDFLVTAATNGALGPSTGRVYVIAGIP
jgi:hypothetical protein